MQTSTAKQWIPVVLLVGAAAASCIYWWQQSRSIMLVDAPSQRLGCVSYAPYHRPNQTPFQEDTRISEAQIEADLQLLSRRFSCVRTYSVQQGLSAVPGIAKRYGMTTLLGLWISRDPIANEQEIALGIEVAKSNHDAIRAIVVGNEVLLRRELPPKQLRDYLLRVHTATGLPVTYADVWEFWLKQRELVSAVSFVTIHVLPYWEDEPVAIEDAPGYVIYIYDRMRQLFPGTPLLIGECGWPSSGRQRGGALPSRVNQAHFIRAFTALADAHGIPYNLVEAFDQPWKREIEGTVGGYWGIYDTEGHEKFPLQGALAENPDWRNGIFSGIMLGFGFVLLALARAPRPRFPGVLVMLCAGIVSGCLLTIQWHNLVTASRNLLEWGVTGSYSALALLSAWVLAQALAQSADSAAALQPAPGKAVWHWLRTQHSTYPAIELGLGALRLTFLFGAAAVSLLLVFDPRYRDFPLALYAIPSVGFALLTYSSPPLHNAADFEEKFLAMLLMPVAAFIAINEGAANQNALAWSGLCALLAFSVLLARPTPQHQ